MAEEIYPDIPIVIHALEETLQRLTVQEDYTKLTKRELATDIEVLLDALMDIAKGLVATEYKVQLLVKSNERKLTLLQEIRDKLDLPEPKKEVEKSINNYDNSLFS